MRTEIAQEATIEIIIEETLKSAAPPRSVMVMNKQRSGRPSHGKVKRTFGWLYACYDQSVIAHISYGQALADMRKVYVAKRPRPFA